MCSASSSAGERSELGSQSNFVIPLRPQWNDEIRPSPQFTRSYCRFLGSRAALIWSIRSCSISSASSGPSISRSSGSSPTRWPRRVYRPATSCSVFVTSSSIRRMTCRLTSSRSSATVDSCDCAINTKIVRKIASRDTTSVNNPNGNGSKGRMPTTPVLTSIQVRNHAAWNTRNGVDAAPRARASATRSIRDRCAA